jgi:hypothetical protein
MHDALCKGGIKMTEQVLDKQEIVDNAIEVVAEWSGQRLPDSGYDGLPEFSFNGLTTPPAPLNRGWLGLLGQLVVLPGTCAVVTGRKGYRHTFFPGTHTLFEVPLGPTTVQWVNTRRQRRDLPPVMALSQDKWQVTLRVAVEYEVDDVELIVQHADPLAALDTAARAAILTQIEALPHDALTGLAEDQDALGGVDAVVENILRHLRASPSVEGFKIINLSIVERKGDERRIKIVQDAVVERTRLAEEGQVQELEDRLKLTQISAHRQMAEEEQAIALVETQTEVRQEQERERLKLMTAQVEAEIEEIHRAQEAWRAEQKRLAEEWRTAKELELLQMQQQHEANLEIIKGTAQVTAEAAKAGKLEGLKVSPRRRPEINVTDGSGRSEVVGEGLEVLRTLRERMAPPTTYFLPQSSGSLNHDPYRRLQLEEARLDKIKGAEYELVMRRGQVAQVTVQVAGHRFEIACPEGYPHTPPEVVVQGPGGPVASPAFEWDADCFLSDLVREALLEQKWSGEESEPRVGAAETEPAEKEATEPTPGES